MYLSPKTLLAVREPRYVPMSVGLTGSSHAMTAAPVVENMEICAIAPVA